MRRVWTDSQPTISTLKFSHIAQFLFIKMSKTYIVIASVKVCVAGGSATVVGLASGDDVIVPLSSPLWLSACESRTSTLVLFRASPSHPSSSREMPNLFVHHVLRIVDHFYQFHLRMILN
jgi:hypothetical protein